MKVFLSAMIFFIIAASSANAADLVNAVTCSLSLDNYPGLEDNFTFKNDGKSHDFKLTYEEKTLGTATARVEMVKSKPTLTFTLEYGDEGHVKMRNLSVTSDLFEANISSLIFSCRQGKIEPTHNHGSWN